MAAVKIPTSCLAFTALGAGIPFRTINSIPTVDEQMAGYMTPPQGHTLIGEIPCIILNITVTVEKTSGAVLTPPVGHRSVPRSNLEKHKACRVLFSMSPARQSRLLVGDIMVEGSSDPPECDLVQYMDRVIGQMADTIEICKAALGTARVERFTYGLKSTAACATSEAKNLASVSSPQPVEYHSDEEQSRFVSMVITPLDDDDHYGSLFPSRRRTGNSEIGPPRCLKICTSQTTRPGDLVSTMTRKAPSHP